MGLHSLSYENAADRGAIERIAGDERARQARLAGWAADAAAKATVDAAWSAAHGGACPLLAQRDTLWPANNWLPAGAGLRVATREIKAAIAAHWCVEHLADELGQANAYYGPAEWADVIARVAVGDTNGMPGGKGAAKGAAREALRQYDAGETDAQVAARAEQQKIAAFRGADNRFSALAALRTGA